MKNRIGIACWSIGTHAVKSMLPAISNCDSVILRGIYTRNQDLSLDQSKLYGCTNYDSCEVLLNDHRVDAVYLSSPTSIHYEQILKCLTHGKSVLVEKSAFSSLEEAQELIEKANEKKPGNNGRLHVPIP